MASNLVDDGATVQCPHGSSATLTAQQTRVKTNGQYVLTSSSQLTVSACPFTVPGPKPQPCSTIRWTGVAGRIKVDGSPPLITPGGTPPAQGVYSGSVPQGPAVATLANTKVTGS